MVCWVAGHTVYHGPREQIMDFFNMMGFSLPARKDPASFLQEVTSVMDQEVSPVLLLRRRQQCMSQRRKLVKFTAVRPVLDGLQTLSSGAS